MKTVNTARFFEDLQIQEVTKTIEEQARILVLKGLKERFGFIDPSYNPDLRNILESYSQPGAVFLVALYKNQVICTGAVSFEQSGIGRVGRMSVLKEFRRTGVAKRMIHCLEAWAKAAGYQQLVLETNNDWQSAIEFYKKMEYTLYIKDAERSHFVKALE